MKYWKIIQNKAQESAEILIYEQIGTDFWGDGITGKQFAEDLKALGEVKHLDIRINSPGGDVFQGLSIFNILKNHKAEKRVFIDGIAASIASVISCVGNPVIMAENSMMFIHDPFAMVIGNSEDMRGMAEVLDKMKTGLISAYRDKTGLDEKKISELMSAESWLSAKECLELGLCDELTEPVRMAASFDLSMFSNVPDSLKNFKDKGEKVKVMEEKNYKKDMYAERDRVIALRAIGKEFKVSDTLLDEAITEGWSEDQLRVTLLSEMKAKAPGPGPIISTSTITGEHEIKLNFAKRGGRKFRDMFGEPVRNATWGAFEEFLKTIHVGGFKAQHLEKVPSEGGFAVPEEFGEFLVDSSLEDEVVRPRATVWPMTSATRKVPAWDGADHSSNLFGGISGQWLTEGGTATNQKGKIRSMQLTANKLACFTQASNELIADGLTFEQMLGDAIKKGVSWFLDLAFLTGSGAGQPQGILNSPSLITVSKESGQLASTILYENLSKMYARLHPSCHKRAVWLANSSAIPQLLQLSLALGTAGVHFPVLKEESGKFYIFGKEVVFTEKLPALGTKGDIILTDLSQYMVGLRRDLSIEKSQGPGWQEDLSSYRVILRADGQASWDKEITPVHGDSLSWAVTLQSR